MINGAGDGWFIEMPRGYKFGGQSLAVAGEKGNGWNIGNSEFYPSKTA